MSRLWKQVWVDAGGNVIFHIEGPFCTFSFCGDVEFKVLSADGNTEVGKSSLTSAVYYRKYFITYP